MNELALGEIQPSDALIQCGFEALRAVRIAAEGTTAACRAVHADVTIPEGGRHVNANEIAFKLCQRAPPLVDKSNEKFSAEIARLQSRIAAPAVDGTVKNIQLQTEIRLFLRDQTPDARRREIVRAIEGADDQVIAAILSAPAMLSGLSPSEVEAYRLQWQLKRWPNEKKRIAQLEKASGAVCLGGSLLLNHQLQMSTPAIVAEAKKFQQASAAAIAQASGAH